jgi:hypothetical protein
VIKLDIRGFVAVVLCGAAALAACGRESRQAASPAPSEGQPNVQPGANEPAIQRLAVARCDLAARCAQIGADKKFATYEACTDDARSDLRDDLRESECPRGINDTQLTNCLTAIGTTSCDNALDAMNRAVACRESALCQK